LGEVLELEEEPQLLLEEPQPLKVAALQEEVEPQEVVEPQVVVLLVAT